MAVVDFNERLLSGERILWTGRPGQGLRLAGRDVFLVPFGLMWLGFVAFWEANVRRQPGAPLFFELWGVPFLLVGAYIAFGRFFVDAWVRSLTAYAVTNRRVLIDRSAPLAKFTALNLDRLPEVQLSEHVAGRGTIVFGQAASYWGGREAGWSYGTPALEPTPRFIAIEDARSVFDQIQRASRSAA